MEEQQLIKEVSVKELHELMKDDSAIDIVNTYVKRTHAFGEEHRAVYRIDGQLYDSIHLFSTKVSEIEGNGLSFQSLEPNKMWEKSDSIQEALKFAVKMASLGDNGLEALKGVMTLWNTIAEDFVLVRKTDLQDMGTPEEKPQEEKNNDKQFCESCGLETDKLHDNMCDACRLT